jgi:hypothetical protein
MGNCYATCHADFEGTVKMVGNARGLSEDEVKAMLKQVKERHGNDEDYKALRKRLPEDFPF